MIMNPNGLRWGRVSITTLCCLIVLLLLACEGGSGGERAVAATYVGGGACHTFRGNVEAVGEPLKLIVQSRDISIIKTIYSVKLFSGQITGFRNPGGIRRYLIRMVLYQEFSLYFSDFV